MTRKWVSWTRVCLIVVTLFLLPGYGLAAPQMQTAQTPPLPIVAIHVSERTQSLDDGGGWYPSWHYAVMPESLKEALSSDGTPWVAVSDADIEAGGLLHPDGAPKYPIVISLAAEVVSDTGVDALRAYVEAGGFLFMGSSAFTRNPDWTSRGDFALADELGLHMINASHDLNWYQNISFTKVGDHRIVEHIPSGTLTWRMPLEAEQTPWGISPGHAVHGAHYVWRVARDDAELIANGGSSIPLLATKGYGKGRLLYHGAMNPLIGVGGNDPGMYAYGIYRNAIAWAFEIANLPIVKLSPWQYPYNAAFTIRHDFENTPSRIRSIKASAQAEHAAGAKGDYYFCTGTLRVGSEDVQMTEAQKLATIADIQTAIQDYGATIGSHNGGLSNPNYDYNTGDYQYWHWGPDEALDTTTLPPAYPDGWTYAYTSVLTSFLDIEGWFTGLDNGRPGCGATGTCPRTWVSPYFNSGREGSYDIMADLGAITMGEQKLTPFPHWTLSYDTPEVRHPHVTLPVSDWYIGTTIAQSLESGHTVGTVRATVDFYYELGALINLYNHSSSAGGVANEYLIYGTSKPRVWATNAVGIYDWWTLRSAVMVTPTYQKVNGTVIAGATVSGATDPETAIELVVPYWETGAIGDLEVLLDGAPADPADYRVINGGVKVKVGTTVSDVSVRYMPLEGWVQTDWSGGPGQAIWEDETRYDSATGIDDSFEGQLRLSVASGGDLWFSDTFTRTAYTPDPLPFTWITPTGSVPWPNKGTFMIDNGVLTAGTSELGPYGYAYTDTVTMVDHSVEADIRFPATFKGGGGLFGRLNPATGQRYAAWIYPDQSRIRLLKFYDQWGYWNSSTGFATYLIPGGFDSNWHHLKMTFTGARIQVYYDGLLIIDETDEGAEANCSTYNSCAPYESGYPGVDLWTSTSSGSLLGPSYNDFTVRDSSDTVVFLDDFGTDPPDPLSPWIRQMGSWELTDETLRTTTKGAYAYVYTSTTPLWTDYTVEGRIQFPAGAFGGGIGGRLDPATGAHYAAWIYPEGSTGGSNVLKVIKFRDWTSWSNAPIGGVIPLPGSVGTGWHTLKMDFRGNRIRVYYDGQEMVDYTDTGYDGRPAYLSGGISVDTWTPTSYGGPYAIAADDIAVRSPAEYGSSGTLLSSAFDGGVGVRWQDIAWNAAAGGATDARVRTRTADRADHLATASWSDWYPTSGVPVTSEDKRWIQYEVELTSSDPNVTPAFYENGITYVPGIKLPGSNLTYTGPASGDSHAQVNLVATLLDDEDAPIVGRTVSFTLGGIPAVSGSTDGSGQVTVPLDLMIAPGDYTLTVAFAGDDAFAPVSISLPFTVTSPWSEWTQDTQVDFASDTLTRTDVLSLPGSVLLEQGLVGEGEESGTFSVSGVPGWGYRRHLFIDNTDTAELPSGYSVKLVLDTEALTGAGKLRADGDDLRVLWDNGTELIELDRVAETAFNGLATEIWFKTEAPIAGEARDGSYYLYYGNPAAGSPPADPAEVYALWDTFDGDTLDSLIWSPDGTVTLSGGQAHLVSGADMISTLPITYGVLEMRVQLVNDNNYSWWGWEDGRGDAPNFVIFEEFPTGFEAIHRDDGAAFTRLPLADPAGGLTTWHTYLADWRPGHVSWSIDGVEVVSATTNLPDTFMYANFYARYVPMDIDWVKARLRVSEEPVVTLATPYLAYPAEGEVLSIVYDTAQFSTWKYLTWEGITPAGTDIDLYVRTAATQAGIATASWTAYDESGLLISNDMGRWVQYRALLRTTDPLATPVLHKVTVYYTEEPATLSLFPNPKTIFAGEAVDYTARVSADGESWDVTGETAFASPAAALGSWVDARYTSEAAGDWTIGGTYANLGGDALLSVNPAAGLVVTKRAAPAPVEVGHTLTYTLVVTNVGPATASNVVLSDVLPSGVSVLSAVPSQGSGCGGTTTVVCPLGDLPKDGVATVQLVVTPTQTGTALNTVRVSGADPYGNGIEATATATVEVVKPEITIVKLPNEQTVTAGSEVGFTIWVTNTGDVALTGVAVSDPLAPDCDVAIGSLVAGTGVHYTCALPDVQADFTNVATATGTAPLVAAAVSATDSAFVDVLPSHTVGKTADPDFLLEPGGPVTFTVRVENHSEEEVTLTRLVDDLLGDLDGVGTCEVPQTIPAEDSYTCTFTGTVTGNAGYSETNTVTADVEDDEGNEVSAEGSTTVRIVDVAAELVVSQSAEPSSLPEPGGTVTFTVQVSNLSPTDVITLTELVDNLEGNLNGQGTCTVPQTLEVGEEYTCTFSTLVTGNSGEVKTNTVTASGVDDDGNPVSDEAEATVTITDVPSGLSVRKTAAPEQVTEPSGTVAYTIRVTNTSAVDTVELTGLMDDVQGDLAGVGSCALPQTLLPGDSYDCAFSAAVSGKGGAVVQSQVTATGTDDDGVSLEAQDTTFVMITDIPSSLVMGAVVTPTTVPDIGGLVTFTVQMTNTSAVDEVTLTGLSDDHHGDLNGVGSCTLPQTLPVGGSYACAFSLTLAGTAGTTEAYVLTVTGEDDDDLPLSESSTVTVTIIPYVPPIGAHKLYLPMVAHAYTPPAPNLVVERIVTTGSTVSVVVKNAGGAAVADAFWVDLYVDPDPAPARVNEVWQDGRSVEGAVWGVSGDALPLAPGATLTLGVGGEHYWSSLSHFKGGLTVGTVLYAQVDSANAETSYGAVLEGHEMRGGPYDNIGYLTLVEAVAIARVEGIRMPQGVMEMPER